MGEREKNTDRDNGVRQRGRCWAWDSKPWVRPRGGSMKFSMMIHNVTNNLCVSEIARISRRSPLLPTCTLSSSHYQQKSVGGPGMIQLFDISAHANQAFRVLPFIAWDTRGNQHPTSLTFDNLYQNKTQGTRSVASCPVELVFWDGGGKNMVLQGWRRAGLIWNDSWETLETEHI